MGRASCGLCGCAALRSASLSSRPRAVERRGLGSREVTIFLCWAVFNTLDLATNLPQLVHLEAGQLAEPKIAPEEQNAIELVPAAYVRRKGLRGRSRPLGCERQKETL